MSWIPPLIERKLVSTSSPPPRTAAAPRQPAAAKPTAAIAPQRMSPLRWTRASSSSRNLLDRLGRADDGDDAGGEAEEEADEETPVPGPDPAVDEQAAPGADHDGNDEREADGPEGPERAHRLLVAHRLLSFCPGPGGRLRRRFRLGAGAAGGFDDKPGQLRRRRRGRGRRRRRCVARRRCGRHFPPLTQVGPGGDDRRQDDENNDQVELAGHGRTLRITGYTRSEHHEICPVR